MMQLLLPQQFLFQKDGLMEAPARTGEREERSPTAIACDPQDVEVQPTQTEAPLSVVAVGALEIRAPSAEIRRDIPAAAALVGKNGKGLVLLSLDVGRFRIAVGMVTIRASVPDCPAEVGGDMLDVRGVTSDTAEAVCYAKGGLVQLCQLLVDAQRRDREDEISGGECPRC